MNFRYHLIIILLLSRGNSCRYALLLTGRNIFLGVLFDHFL